MRRRLKSIPAQTALIARGFTLIEMLVVIAVIGVLAGLIFPALVRAKSHARSTACVGHLRQMGFALTMYLGDYGAYPAGPTLWQRQLSVYSTDYDREMSRYHSGERYRNPAYRDMFWVCPELEPKQETVFDDMLNRHFPAYQVVVSQYAINARGTGAGIAVHGLAKFGSSVKESEVRVPSDMIAVADHWRVGSNLGTSHQVHWPSSRHRGGANVLFCDGHIEFGKQESWVADTPEARRRWNRDNTPDGVPSRPPPGPPPGR
jgi:prepilin-type N-terminal cleavage/methylation domain-containing protein/prepilin-type processing-associated H-X9-DG protein